ncbi:MAG: hypothetical protein HQK49_16675 [Oligoflexia bacterium]|nr:hypothetical protein [Oligoflexia bacterium]
MGIRICKTIRTIRTSITLGVIFLLTSINAQTFDYLFKDANLNFNSKTESDFQQVIKEYLSIEKKFRKEVCKNPNQIYNRYKGLMARAYTSEGMNIPLFDNGTLDIDAIVAGLPEIEMKLNWLTELITNHKRQMVQKGGFAKVKKDIHAIEGEMLDLLEQLLTDKENYHRYLIENRGTNKNSNENMLLMARESKYKIINLFKLYRSLLAQVPFMLNYTFPVNHQLLRRDYDRVKYKKDIESIKLKNKLQFYRRIKEDGLPVNFNLDRQFRAIISNTYVNLEELEKSKESFITEDLRYDIASIFRYIDLVFKRSGERNILHGLQLWRERVQRGYNFYKLLINKGEKNLAARMSGIEGITDFDQYLKDVSKSRYNLKDYTFSKFLESYLFWSKQKEIWQALFVIETILTHEAGRLDGKDALERRDIVQLILNRFKVPFYNSFAYEDPFYSYLKRVYSKDEEFQKNKWLNLLFKEGEFSFTYYFIPSSFKIYCPSNSNISNLIRKENLTLGLELLRTSRTDFPVLRFFSRISMLGRIDMAPLWNEYLQMPERPGNEIKEGIDSYVNDVINRNYKFLYFIPNGASSNGQSPNGQSPYYVVAEFNNINKQNNKFKKISNKISKKRTVSRGKILVFREEKSTEGQNISKIHFYHYRDSQLFRFFKEKMPMGIGKGITHFASSANLAPGSEVLLGQGAGYDTLNTSDTVDSTTADRAVDRAAASVINQDLNQDLPPNRDNGADWDGYSR